MQCTQDASAVGIGSDAILRKWRADDDTDDRVLLAELLQAAGIPDLDAPNHYIGGAGSGQTYRRTGIALELAIHYSNLGEERSTYSYRASLERHQHLTLHANDKTAAQP